MTQSTNSFVDDEFDEVFEEKQTELDEDEEEEGGTPSTTAAPNDANADAMNALAASLGGAPAQEGFDLSALMGLLGSLAPQTGTMSAGDGTSDTHAPHAFLRSTDPYEWTTYDVPQPPSSDTTLTRTNDAIAGVFIVVNVCVCCVQRCFCM